MPLWAKHSLVTVEYCSNLEKLKHIIGTILEGVRTLITCARVFAHANARVRVQADLVLFRPCMTKWGLLKAELEMVSGCRQGGGGGLGDFYQTHMNVGVHIYVSQDASTHTGRKRMQKQQENTCAYFKVVMRGAKKKKEKKEPRE